MGNQVQILEELLARVQRNRMNMDAASLGARKLDRAVEMPSAASEKDGSGSAEAVLPEHAEIIDLVNPTSVAPDSPVPSGAGERPALQTAPVASTTDQEVRGEDDFSSVAPASVAPVPAAPVPAGKPRERAEDDFSSVAPTSAAPAPPVELPPSMAPVDIAAERNDPFAVKSEPVAPPLPVPSKMPQRTSEADSDTLDVIPPSMLPDAEPAVYRGKADSGPDEDELELVNTDTASMHPGMPQATTSLAALHASASQGARPEGPSPEQIEKRSFEREAVASGEIVQMPGAMPEPKSWTIEAVLRRAWQLGKSR